MNAGIQIELPMEELTEFCRRNHIRKLSLFGSVLRDDFRPDSDVDALVEFEEGYRPGFAFFRLGEELGEVLGRPVDFVTVQGLNKYIRKRVLSEARQIYDAA